MPAPTEISRHDRVAARRRAAKTLANLATDLAAYPNAGLSLYVLYVPRHVFDAHEGEVAFLQSSVDRRVWTRRIVLLDSDGYHDETGTWVWYPGIEVTLYTQEPPEELDPPEPGRLSLVTSIGRSDGAA